MGKRSNKGTTLIELMISTAMISIVMLTVYSVWNAGSASARHCIEMSESTDAPFILLNNFKKQLEELNIQQNKELPVDIKYSGSKLYVSIFTYYGLWADTDKIRGPFNVKYVYDKNKHEIWYWQEANLNFDSKTVVKDNFELLTSDIEEFEIEYYSDNSWKSVINNKIDSGKVEMIRVNLVQVSKNKKNQFSITTSIK